MQIHPVIHFAVLLRREVYGYQITHIRIFPTHETMPTTLVNQPCPIFKVSQQIAGTICPINIYKNIKVYKSPIQENLSEKIYVFCSELSSVTDIFYPQIPSIALLNYVINSSVPKVHGKFSGILHPLN